MYCEIIYTTENVQLVNHRNMRIIESDLGSGNFLKNDVKFILLSSGYLVYICIFLLMLHPNVYCIRLIAGGTKAIYFEATRMKPIPT